MPYTNFPLKECGDAVDKIIRENKGAMVYQKWTCAKCGERVTANNPNIFTTRGYHQERNDGKMCQGVTDIEKDGCNYQVRFQARTADEFEAAMKFLEGRA